MANLDTRYLKSGIGTRKSCSEEGESSVEPIPSDSCDAQASLSQCKQGHIAICYQHGNHHHNECVPIDKDIKGKVPGADMYKDKYPLVNCGCCKDNILGKIKYPKDYEKDPYCDYLTPGPTSGPTSGPTAGPTGSPVAEQNDPCIWDKYCLLTQSGRYVTMALDFNQDDNAAILGENVENMLGSCEENVQCREEYCYILGKNVEVCTVFEDGQFREPTAEELESVCPTTTCKDYIFAFPGDNGECDCCASDNGSLCLNNEVDCCEDENNVACPEFDTRCTCDLVAKDTGTPCGGLGGGTCMYFESYYCNQLEFQGCCKEDLAGGFGADCMNTCKEPLSLDDGTVGCRRDTSGSRRSRRRG